MTTETASLRRQGLNVYAIVSSVTLAVVLFYVGRRFPSLQQLLRSGGYVATFVLGILFVYSFTSLPAAALLLLIAKAQNVWLAGTIATFGAVVGDLVLFWLFRSVKRFADDGPLPHRERYAGWWQAIEARIPPSWQAIVITTLVVMFFVLPLPNEFADFLLARTRKVTTTAVIVISYVLNGVGLFGITWLARFG